MTFAKAGVSAALLLLSVLLLSQNVLADGQLLFRSNFGPGLTYEERLWAEKDYYRPTLTGTDGSTGYSWDRLWSSDQFRAVIFQYASNQPYENYVTTEIRRVPGPFGNTVNALFMEVKGDDPTHGAVTRNELQLRPQSDLRQLYIKYWMKLDEDYLAKLPESGGWNVIWELKEPTDEHFRATLYIEKYGSHESPFWEFRIREEGSSVHSEQNYNVAIPFGEWFQVETFYRYDSGSNGRFYFAVNGRPVFDYRGPTKHRTDSYNRIDQLSFFKNYRGTAWYRSGASVHHYYTGLEIWTDFPTSPTPPLAQPNTPIGVNVMVH